MGWYNRSAHLLTTKDNATHVIVGREPGKHFGIVGYTRNQFDAYRVRKELIADGGQDIKVAPATDRVLEAIDNDIEKNFFRVEG